MTGRAAAGQLFYWWNIDLKCLGGVISPEGYITESLEEIMSHQQIIQGDLDDYIEDGHIVS